MAASVQEIPTSEPDRASRSDVVAVLDRDSGLQLVLENRLSRAGWQRLLLSRAPRPAALAEREVDAVIVDVALLGKRWLQWLAELSVLRPDLPVLVCTGSSSVADRVYGLRAGAADWLAKPCHPEELLARLQAITLSHRRGPQRDLETIVRGNLEIRPDLFEAFVDGLGLGLTRREYGLLELLARADGAALSREQLYESVWRREMAHNDRAVDVFIHKLRDKLHAASPGMRYIHTEFRVGYRLVPEPVEGLALLREAAPSGAGPRRGPAAERARRRSREPLAA